MAEDGVHGRRSIRRTAAPVKADRAAPARLAKSHHLLTVLCDTVIVLSMTPLWTLDELSAQVALSLSVGYAGQASGRVREVPDRRTIRYYTTLGLLDRPAAMRGRTALYGRRHLAQLVAIKRLQARGLSLVEIQARLLGLSDRRLEQLAQLPTDGEAPAAEARSEPGRRAEAFWAAPPAAAPPAPEPAGVRVLTWLPLAEGATLLLEAARPSDEYDLEEVRAAAAPLLRLLRARRLLAAERGDTSQGETP
jgi:DNA-binding transcriptional MerR regulator